MFQIADHFLIISTFSYLEFDWDLNSFKPHILHNWIVYISRRQGILELDGRDQKLRRAAEFGAEQCESCWSPLKLFLKGKLSNTKSTEKWLFKQGHLFQRRIIIISCIYNTFSAGFERVIQVATLITIIHPTTAIQMHFKDSPHIIACKQAYFSKYFFNIKR